MDTVGIEPTWQLLESRSQPLAHVSENTKILEIYLNETSMSRNPSVYEGGAQSFRTANLAPSGTGCDDEIGIHVFGAPEHWPTRTRGLTQLTPNLRKVDHLSSSVD